MALEWLFSFQSRPLKVNGDLGSTVVPSYSEGNGCDRCRRDYGMGNYILNSCWTVWHVWNTDKNDIKIESYSIRQIFTDLVLHTHK